jgi:hypothetical protein
MTVASSSTTSRLPKRANATDARPSKKSPDRIDSLLPNIVGADGEPRRSSDVSITSSCSNEATWIISVMEASLRCVGRMAGDSDWSRLGIRGVSGTGLREDPPIVNGDAYAVGPSGPIISGFQSFNTPPSLRLSSTPLLLASSTAPCQPDSANPFVACAMSNTKSGLRCLPSA